MKIYCNYCHGEFPVYHACAGNPPIVTSNTATMKPAEENFQAMIENEAQLNSDKELDLAGFRTRQEHRICAFKAGVAFARQNLVHIPEVKELVELVQDYQCHLEILKKETGFHSSIEIDIKKALQKLEKGTV